MASAPAAEVHPPIFLALLNEVAGTTMGLPVLTYGHESPVRYLARRIASSERPARTPLRVSRHEAIYGGMYSADEHHPDL